MENKYCPSACRQFDSAPGHQYKAKAPLEYSLGAFSIRAACVGYANFKASLGADDVNRLNELHQFSCFLPKMIHHAPAP